MQGQSFVRLIVVFIVSAFALIDVSAQSEPQYRAYWVDTFNTTLNNHNDIVKVVDNVKKSNSNAIFAQVRRRGDAWYLNSLEPAPDTVPIEAGFDPLQDLINEAHANGIEVHAFVIVGAVYNRHPVISGLPSSPNHVFNQHGGFNPTTGQVVPGPNNWMTRTLLPDGAAGITFQGHRFGAEFWIDLGHPDAAAWTTDVLTHLIRNYNIDGIHLDRIRYPEISVSGQTPSSGTNIGYNETSVNRFQQYYGIAAGSPPPAQNDPLWSQWRRDQVTNLVRRVYLNAISIRPNIKLSTASIAFGSGPTTETAWKSSEAYWRVYQDWRAWTEEGILDLALPMNYKTEHSTTGMNTFNQWSEWLKNHQYNRGGLLGLAPYLNGVEGTLRQTRRSFDPSSLGNKGLGVVYFSMANTSAAVTANPYSIPAGQNTPKRNFDEFAAAVTTGKSVNGTVQYEDPVANPVPVFSSTASIPVLSWKASPTVGHLMGFAHGESNALLDTADITITNLTDNIVRNTKTDGGGFYGSVDLAPGSYQVKAVFGSVTAYSKILSVEAGNVTVADLSIDSISPTVELSANPSIIWPPNGKDWPITIKGAATDDHSGLASVSYEVIDEYGSPLSIAPRSLSGHSSNWEETLIVQASRLGKDKDGRKFIVTATIVDTAGNKTIKSVYIVVPHDHNDF